MTKTSPCLSCHSPDGSLRVCTKQVLCERCRSLPDYRIMTCAAVKKSLGLPESAFLHLRTGHVANPVDRRFRRVGVYYWKDVATFCLDNGLEIPE